MTDAQLQNIADELEALIYRLDVIMQRLDHNYPALGMSDPTVRFLSGQFKRRPGDRIQRTTQADIQQMKQGEPYGQTPVSKS